MEEFVFSSPIGHYLIQLDRTSILSVSPTTRSLKRPQSQLGTRVLHALQAYFTNPGSPLTPLPLLPPKRPFQRCLRAALLKIPFGHVITYGDLAKNLNSSPRAIGQACRRNPLPLIVPCHRVIGKKVLGGYGGPDQNQQRIKQWLLNHEQCAQATV